MILNKPILLVLGILLAGCQTNPIQPSNNVNQVDDKVELTLEQACVKYKCRENFRIHFKTESQVVDQTVELFWPRIFDNSISIMPGESFFVEADLVDNRLVNLREVPEIKHPEKTITLSFTQSGPGLGMILSLKNPFDDVALKFNMDMVDFEGNPHRTSSCPALANASIYESWPHVIPELIISNPVAIPASEMTSVSCVY